MRVGAQFVTGSENTASGIASGQHVTGSDNNANGTNAGLQVNGTWNTASGNSTRVKVVTGSFNNRKRAERGQSP